MSFNIIFVFPLENALACMAPSTLLLPQQYGTELDEMVEKGEQGWGGSIRIGQQIISINPKQNCAHNRGTCICSTL